MTEKKFIIKIKTKYKSNFGIEFMEGSLRNVIKVLNGYKKGYNVIIEDITE